MLYIRFPWILESLLFLSFCLRVRFLYSCGSCLLDQAPGDGLTPLHIWTTLIEFNEFQSKTKDTKLGGSRGVGSGRNHRGRVIRWKWPKCAGHVWNSLRMNKITWQETLHEYKVFLASRVTSSQCFIQWCIENKVAFLVTMWQIRSDFHCILFHLCLRQDTSEDAVAADPETTLRYVTALEDTLFEYGLN